MSNPKPLVPVFIPSLSAVLVAAEDKKGAPLTESEVIQIRDKSPCIMMEREDAAKLVESRGYRDVDPENAGTTGRWCGAN